jgi:hypothetical protein
MIRVSRLIVGSAFYMIVVFALLGSQNSAFNRSLAQLAATQEHTTSIIRINEFSYHISYHIMVRRSSAPTNRRNGKHFLVSNTNMQDSKWRTPQPPPITYPICLSKSDYLKAFGTLSFPQANQLPVYSWDGGPGCPTQKKAAGNAGGGGGGAATPLAVAIDQLWTTQGAKLLPPPSGSFDPPTAITGARVYLVSRSVPSVSIDLTFHGATLAFDATSALWVQWSPGDPVAGPFPPTSSGWPSGAIHHTYSEPGPHSVEVTERWQVVWSFDGHSGVLPAVVRTAALPLKVQTLRRILLAPA